MSASQRERCEAHAKTWSSLQEKLNVSSKRTPTYVFDCIEDVILHTEDIAKTEYQSQDGKNINVLVTGSLHLVGTFLSLLDPNICD